VHLNADFNFKQIREHDLLLMSATKLDSKVKDIKMIANKEGLLRRLLQKSGIMFAFVTKKALGAPPPKKGSGQIA